MNTFEHTRRPRFFQIPKQTEEFTITWNGKQVKARGSKKLYDLLIEFKSVKYSQTQVQSKDTLIVRTLQRQYGTVDRTNMLFAHMQLKAQEGILDSMLTEIDTIFFKKRLQPIIGKIDAIFSTLESGIAGSITILKNTVLIEINLLQFIVWFNVLKGQRKQSMGTENCDSILKCMLKTLQHELVHAICILCSPTIYVNGKAIGSLSTLNVKGDNSNAATGHSTWYMDLLGNIFGQKNDFHDNYTYRQKAKLRV
tara:strand:+ start:5577 stop:6335 length:759 start_codon:yes stop_codon:yes gene_type:complete